MNKSFTLIEILVVIVVIGVLSAFILVGMSSITNSANIAKGKTFANSLRNSLLMNLISEWKFDGTGVADGQPATIAYTQDNWRTNNGAIIGHEPDVKSGTNCVSGSCLQFTSANSDYLDCAEGNNAFDFGTGNFTVSAWINVYSKSGTSDWRGIVGKNASTDTDANTPFILWYYYGGNNKAYFYIGNGATSVGTSTQTVSLNKFAYVVFSVDASYIRPYLNSVNGTNVARTINPVANDLSLFIGKGRDPSVNYYFDGIIDEVRIYNEALSTSQIKQNYYLGLNNLFKSQGITLNEFNQRIVELKYNLASYE